MKEYVIVRSTDGDILLKEVKVKNVPYFDRGFVYKNDDGYYSLIDRRTGLAICVSKKLKDLEYEYIRRRSKYLQIIEGATYVNLVNKFEELKKKL